MINKKSGLIDVYFGGNHVDADDTRVLTDRRDRRGKKYTTIYTVRAFIVDAFFYFFSVPFAPNACMNAPLCYRVNLFVL